MSTFLLAISLIGAASQANSGAQPDEMKIRGHRVEGIQAGMPSRAIPGVLGKDWSITNGRNGAIRATRGDVTLVMEADHTLLHHVTRIQATYPMKRFSQIVTGLHRDLGAPRPGTKEMAIEWGQVKSCPDATKSCLELKPAGSSFTLTLSAVLPHTSQPAEERQITLPSGQKMTIFGKGY